MKTIGSNWQGALLVCGKCSRKIGGGFGANGKRPLDKALRKAMAVKRNRKAALGIVEIGCLNLCPAGAVTLVDTREPGRWLVVPKGADVALLAERLRVTIASVPAGRVADQTDHVGNTLRPV